jgi:saccharopine dehydrogenase-like NADP-dependent oxidoreductase
MRVVVLGGGLVGGVMAKDLAKDRHIEVTVADRDEGILNRIAEKHPIKGIKADFSNSKIIDDIVKDFDLVIGAVPGFLGYNMLKTVIEAGKNISDISFAPEDFMELDGLAKEKGVTAVVDCGVAPGMSNMIVGYATSLLDEPERCLIMVGGLPVVREWPYEYKIVFSAIDVIDEYLRPSRLVENGKIAIKPALSELELVDLPGVGTLEAFNTDGLRSLAYTMNIPDMKEKTLRFPGHVDRMRMLRETGFFSYDTINVKGVEVRPIDVTANLLFPKWKLKEGEREFTVMRIEVEGKKDGKRILYRYDLLDYFDDETKTTSMARTTGFPCAIMGRLIANGVYNQKGIIPPELIGNNHMVFNTVMDELKVRGVMFKESVIEL